MNNLKVILLFAFAFVHLAVNAAGTYKVNKNGNGDFTTIQGAVDQAAADEDTGPVRRYAYFTQGSDIVYVSDGTSGLSVGGLISADENTWYEIMEIVDNQNLRLTRGFDENNVFGSYKAVAVSEIVIRPGIYEESINLQNVHFVRFRGITLGGSAFGNSSRESVTIQPSETTNGNGVDGAPFYNIQDYGALYFENLTARRTAAGGVMLAENTANIFGLPEPHDMNLSLKNVHLDAQCCDVILSSYGHVLIENSRMEGENDVFGGYFKSLTMRRSDIMSLRTFTALNVGKAVFIKIRDDSLIENSLILTKAHYPNDPTIGSGIALMVRGTSGSTLTIRDSVVVNDAGSGASALQLDVEPNTVVVEGSKLIARTTSGTGLDITMDVSDSLTVQCTEYVTNAGAGTPTVLPCP